MWERDFNHGQLAEAELAFHAQDDDGNVWNLGEYPEVYEQGKLVGAEDTWITGLARARAGILMRAEPRVGSSSYLQGWAPEIEFRDRAREYKSGQRSCVPVDCFNDVLVTDECNPLDPPDGTTGRAETKRHRLLGVPFRARREGGTTGVGTRRKTALGIALVAVVTASAVGWVAGRRIQSPAEIASRTAPPAPSLISVPVELRTLTSDVVARGTVRYGSPQTVTLPASPLKPGTSIVSIAPVKGAALNEGSVAFSLSGRPVLVLQGAQPAYRDLGPGAAGEDVRQLQAALARLGFDPGALNGVYGASTAGAVAAWYRSAGWTPLGPTDEQLQSLRTAESEEFGARSERANAEDALTTARNSRTTANATVRTTV